jgi:hypothetical protein
MSRTASGSVSQAIGEPRVILGGLAGAAGVNPNNGAFARLEKERS